MVDWARMHAGRRQRLGVFAKQAQLVAKSQTVLGPLTSLVLFSCDCELPG